MRMDVTFFVFVPAVFCWEKPFWWEAWALASFDAGNRNLTEDRLGMKSFFCLCKNVAKSCVSKKSHIPQTEILFKNRAISYPS